MRFFPAKKRKTRPRKEPTIFLCFYHPLFPLSLSGNIFCNKATMSDAPPYQAIHTALKEELSPRRAAYEQDARGHTQTSPAVHRVQCDYSSLAVADVDAILKQVPQNMSNPELALASLLSSRGALADHYRTHLSQADATPLPQRVATNAHNFYLNSKKPDVPKKVFGSPIRRKILREEAHYEGKMENIGQVVQHVADILGIDTRDLPESLLADALEPLPDVYFGSPGAEGKKWNQSLSAKEKARVCTEHILKERPWIDTESSLPPLDETAAAAAAHLLLYAEGIQGLREMHYQTPKKGREVTCIVEVGSGKGKTTIAAKPGDDGIVVAVDDMDETLLAVKFDLRRDNVDASVPVFNVPAASVKVKHRRLIPIEAIERWGAKGKEHPSVAAHTPIAQSTERKSASRSVPPPSLNSVLRPLVHAVGGEGVLAQHLSLDSMETTLPFTPGVSQAFHLRVDDSVGAGKSMDSRQYNSVVMLIGRYVTVVDDPLRISHYCEATFDKNVDVYNAVAAAGCLGKVTEVNIAAETARIVIYGKGLAPWLPLACLAIKNKDPFLVLGCRQTSVSVLGAPNKCDIQKAATSIAAHEEKLRRQRRV